MQSICQRERYIVVPDQISGEFRNPHLPHHNVACLIRHAAQPHLLVWTSGFGSVHVLRRRESQLPYVLLRASSVPSLAIQRSWQSRRFWWDANCDDISCFCDIGHDVKSAVHMGCVTSGGLVEQFHSPFPLCCAMSSAWKFFSTSAKRCRPARGKYLNAHPR